MLNQTYVTTVCDAVTTTTRTLVQAAVHHDLWVSILFNYVNFDHGIETVGDLAFTLNFSFKPNFDLMCKT